MTERYLNIMEAAFSAYGEEHVAEYFDKVRRTGLTEHGFPRLTANLVILIARGRQTHLKAQAEEMLRFCCRAMPSTRQSGNDFSVKELVYALLEAEESGVFPSGLIKDCRTALGRIDPLVNYDCIAHAPDEEVGNWAAYNAASEFLRQAAGLCDASGFLARQLPTQLRMFDENGMYRDPHEPMLYDAATRVQLAILLREGYTGSFRDAILKELVKSEPLTLAMQSVSGILPYGGRSNQFLFNEAYLAALCEFYAALEQEKGYPETAGQFKDAAALACDSIEEALRSVPVRHVRNRYEQLSDAGCESYAYFDKYMISLASFIYVALRFADDSIRPLPCPARLGGYIAATSPRFHKLFCSAGGYFLEFDLDADIHYDASGLGRVHKAGVPMPLCLSVPFPGTEAQYRLPTANAVPLSLCATRLPEDGAPRSYRVVKAELRDGTAEVTLRPTDGGWTETYRVAPDGVSVTAVSDDSNAVCYHLPVFDFDGAEHTAVETARNEVTVTYRGAVCRFGSNVPPTDTGARISNRNGVYRHLLLRGTRIALDITLTPQGTTDRPGGYGGACL